MQIPILNGIYTDSNSDFRTSYPRNLVPVPKGQGISNGYLRPGDGIVELGIGPGIGRGGINWSNSCYRVMGSSLVKINSDFSSEILGSISGLTRASLDYSFDRLAVASDNKLWYYDGSSLQQVTDPDLGVVLDVIWVDGYFMTTDGEFLVVTDLNDPFSINPLKYGSSEADPDPIKALVKVRNEPYVLNRYTIEVFDNIGGSGFPFQRIDGAQVQRGTVGTHTCCNFIESVAFVGGGRGESIAVWLVSSGSSAKLSTREIDIILSQYTEEVLESSVLESRVDKGHRHLYLHLPDQTLVYDAAASQEIGESVWFTLVSSLTDKGQYRARDFIWCYNKWLCIDPTTFSHGELVMSSSDHWGEKVVWEFGTTILYNEGRGAIFHELELVCLTGRIQINSTEKITTQYSLDGEYWSVPKSIGAGKSGQRNKRLVWLQQGPMEHWRIQRFIGTSRSRISPARLEVQLEPLMV